MKRTFILILLTFIMSLPCLAAEPETRGVWVSTVYNLDFPSKDSLSESQMKKEIDDIVYSAADAGLNTIFLQVRPECDSIYPSKIFPWSKYISGKQGTSPVCNFDILSYFINSAHTRGIKLHAWINPYRVSVSSFESLSEGLDSLCDGHPAKQNPEWVKYGYDKKLYFDPAIPEVQQLIIDGIIELAENYDIDGIHLDDYFYPEGAFDDSDSFEKYGADFKDIDDFRRNNVNITIQKINNSCEKYNLIFGISPFGIWANYIYNELGSTTAGNQSYYSHYADSRLWVKEGWVDYIAPQLYWAINSDEGEFERLLLWWRDVVSGTGVDLYIGLASYRSIDASIDSVWYEDAEIIRQLKMIDMYGQTDGVIFFRYQSLNQSKNLKEYTGEIFTYPMPDIGRPIFLRNSRSFDIISPSGNNRVVSKQNFEVICNASSLTKLSAITDSCTAPLRRITDGLSYNIDVDKYAGILFLCERSGFLSLKPTGLQLLSSENKNALVDIDWQYIDGYTKLTFFTDYPATAKTYYNNEYLCLEISPARVGLVFECDPIRTMVCEKLNGYVKYTFDFYNTTTECFTKEYDDRIEVYIK